MGFRQEVTRTGKASHGVPQVRNGASIQSGGHAVSMLSIKLCWGGGMCVRVHVVDGNPCTTVSSSLSHRPCAHPQLEMFMFLQNWKVGERGFAL